MQVAWGLFGGQFWKGFGLDNKNGWGEMAKCEHGGKSRQMWKEGTELLQKSEQEVKDI